MISSGPRITQDGLIACYDSYDYKSYQGEPATNLLSNGDFENNSTAGWSFDAKTDGSWSVISSEKKHGTYCAELTNSTVDSIALWQGFSMNTGEKYTMSCWIKNISCPTTPFFNVTNATFDENASTSITTGVTEGSDWVYVSKTFTTHATGTCNPYIRTSANSSQGQFLVDDFQVEKNGYATPFVNGTRSTTNTLRDRSTLSYATTNNITGSNVYQYRDGSVITPYTNAYINYKGNATSYTTVTGFATSYDNYTLEFWIKINGAADSDRLYSWDVGGTLTVRWRTTPRFEFHYNPDDGSPASTSTYGPTLTNGDGYWHHLVITNDFTDTSTGLKVYTDGVAGTGGEPAVALGTSNHILGTGFTGINPTECDIAVFRVYSRSLSAKEVLGNYNVMKGRFNV